ncbi:MAG: HAMP domain-containing protein [Deltaproteobacteria bacterium]|nr:MAG: HAMP domain-containing protein [Deltaproteobacteria bacterium]
MRLVKGWENLSQWKLDLYNRGCSKLHMLERYVRFRAMKFGIFSRLTVNYLIVFSLLVASNAYAILKLRQFNAGTSHMLKVDVRILDYKKRLVDSVFSELLYERKYIITKDEALYHRFLSSKDDFRRQLAELSSIADTPAKTEALGRIKAYHERYESLVDAEVNHLQQNQSYSKKWYTEEKEKASNGILQESETLEGYSKEDVYDQMKRLNEFGNSARKLAIALSLAATLLGVSACFFITRSITRPLTAFAKKTREISVGIFKSDLRISSPPEVSDLTRAFNLMCDRLKAVDKMKLDFFSTMSHELRTPLTSIREGTSLLLEGVGGTIVEKQKRLLTILAVQTDRLIDLVNSVLDFSKMEAGMMTYAFEPGSISPLIEQTMMEMAPLVETKRIRFERKIDGEVPLVNMDVDRILQVLRNLMGNAIKFTPEGGRITIAARPAKGGLEVSVADTGPGISRENLTTIFEKFRSSDHTRGTGLGLAIVKHIVAAHGGRVWAESKPGEGSIFWLWLGS